MNANGDDHVSFTAMDIALEDTGRYITVATGILDGNYFFSPNQSTQRQRPFNYVPPGNRSASAQFVWFANVNEHTVVVTGLFKGL